MHSNCLKLATWLAVANNHALFQRSVPSYYGTLKFVYDIGSRLLICEISGLWRKRLPIVGSFLF